MILQNTLAEPVSFNGISLHHGVRTTLTLCPAPENTGIVFRRVDLPGKPEVRAVAASVTEVQRATTLENGAAKIHTVEHVIAALHAMEIDNCTVEMNNVEPPIADGSAWPFVQMIQKAGIRTQNAEAKIFNLSTPISLEVNDTQMVMFPADDFKITAIIDFGSSPLDKQFFSTVVTPETFAEELSKARTFCQYKELEYLINHHLALGGSLDNAMIIHDQAIIAKDGQRYPTELVRHKMLDIVGDFYLLGARARGHLIAVKPGHGTNAQFVQKMLNTNTPRKDS